MPYTAPSLTIDFIVHVFYTGVLAPLPAALIPITLLARGIDTNSTAFYASVVYFGVVCLVRLAGYVDHRIAYGAPRQMDWEDEVVLITGGAGGLGGLIAEVYGMRGVPVAVLDVKPRSASLVAEMESRGIEYYQCDVGDARQVAATAKKVEEELGTVTILVNNAAVAHGSTLTALTTADIEETYRVNVLAHHYTVKQFLPGMLRRRNGGTIVTVSSVLGHLGCASLSAYTASKAAVTAMHKSLVAELRFTSPSSSSVADTTAAATGPSISASTTGRGPVKTILVEPGQLNTALFADIKPPSEFLGPPVSPAQLAGRIIAAIDAGVSAEIAEPLYARWIALMDILPAGMKGLVRTLAGLDRAAWEAYVGVAVEGGREATHRSHHDARQADGNSKQEMNEATESSLHGGKKDK